MPHSWCRLICSGTALALGACVTPSQQPVQLSLSSYAGTGLRTVAVKVGSETLPFILDTGAGFTVIASDQTASAGCTPFGQVAGYRADGQKLTMSRCGPVALGIERFKTTAEVAVFDLNALLGKGAPPVGGLVGMASFEDQAVTLDFAHERLIVETRHSLASRIRTMRPVHLRIARGAGGDVVPFIEVRAKTGTLWMEIDSGNNGPVFLSPHALDQLGLQIPKNGETRIDADVIGLGLVPMTVKSREMIVDGQLNPTFLRRIVLSIDFARQQAWASVLPDSQK